jgi:arylsulfatase A-like enzyme
MDVLPVPLFIKEPNQRKGKISDVNAQAIDVLPTIADLLDVPLPWKVDGVSLIGTPATRAGKTVYFDDAKRVRTFPASLLSDYMRRLLASSSCSALPRTTDGSREVHTAN